MTLFATIQMAVQRAALMARARRKAAPVSCAIP
jgi:hypothetical protein